MKIDVSYIVSYIMLNIMFVYVRYMMFVVFSIFQVQARGAQIVSAPAVTFCQMVEFVAQGVLLPTHGEAAAARPVTFQFVEFGSKLIFHLEICHSALPAVFRHDLQ